MAGAGGRTLFVFDVARAGAAVLVLLSHARSLTLVDADEADLGWVGRIVYGVTGLGHQAVIVFFVVSGFLVTRSIGQRGAEVRWSIARFATDRLTRLWTVLLPCLVLGAVCDHAGLFFAGPEIDPARYGVLALTAPAAPALDLATFVGNAAFLQTILVPPFGSNGPLWSLANEAWYYAAAGVGFAIWRAELSSPQRLAGWAGLLGGFCLLPRSILDLAPIWLFGAALAIAVRGLSFDPPAWARLAAVACFLACLGAARSHLGGHPLVLDYALGLATTAALGLHLGWQGRESVVRVAGLTARLSYSLYLSHCPILVLATALVLHQHRLPFGLQGSGLMAAEFILAFVVATIVWWGFERHTAALRKGLTRWPGLPIVRAWPRPTQDGAAP